MYKMRIGYILVAITLFIIFVSFSGTFAAVQESFVLDLDSPLFRYNESVFNDSASSQVNVYNGSENVTYWIRLPKNSTIINATLNVTGKIVPIYETSVIANGLVGISIGNVTVNDDIEISVGTKGNDGTIRLLYGFNGSVIWSSAVSVNSQIFSTYIGNVTSDSGNEVAAGSEDNYVYLLNSTGGELWNMSTGGDVKSIKIYDLYDDGTNEVIAGSDKVYVINMSGGENWSVNIADCAGINELAVGNVTSDSGNEIVVGCDGGDIFVLNSSGSVVLNATIGASAINSVDIGNVTSDAGNEIAAGSADNSVYILNSTFNQAWNYSTGGSINNVRIGDATTQYDGNEVVCGSNDQKVYTLDNDGSLIWDFEASSFVNTIDIGNLTKDGGDEVAAGAGNGYLYAFNFDYFPTNLSIDVGGIMGYDWNYSGKLRTTVMAWGFGSAIQIFLDSCTADADGFCNVSLVFHSDYTGELNVSGVNITYNYNATPDIIHSNVSAWSRTNNIRVNESVGNYVKNISFISNPANDIVVRYVKVNSTATSCDFNGTSYSVASVDGKTVCDITSFTIPSTGSLPPRTFLWDNNVSTGIPVRMTENGTYNTTGLDNYRWRKNFSIYNVTGFPEFTLTNVTANVTLNDSEVKGLEFLRVWWSGQPCNITPPSSSSDCNTSSPTYFSQVCGSDTFWTCKIDTDSDGVYDYFGLKQSSFVVNTSYQVGGSNNLNANLTNPNVNPGSEIWGKNFNFTVNVEDNESDVVNVTLWVRLNVSNTWVSQGTVNATSAQTIQFYVTSDNSWVGLDSYKFEYQDFNSTGDPIHSKENTTAYSGPDVKRHNVSVIYFDGNESYVNRGTPTRLIVRVNDTNESAWVGSGVACRFWVTTNGSLFDSGHDNVTNSSGHCIYDFVPDGSYMTGNQTWKAGTFSDTYYLDGNSSGFVVVVKGRTNITLSLPQNNQSLLRNSDNLFLARMIDEYGDAVNVSGFNCSFWFNGSYINSSDTNATGWCNYTWNPSCGADLGTYWVNVTLSGSSNFYSIWDNESNARINMTDELNITVKEPTDLSSYHKGEIVSFNTTSNDTCTKAAQGDYNVTWHKKWKRMFRIDINESSGINRTREPFVINGTQLEDMGIDLNDWRINYTRVYTNGTEVTAEVKAWTNGSKTEINDTLVYMNNYSELVFLVDITKYQSKPYWVYYNETNPTDFNITYIPNGGFENNDTTSWYYDESDSNCYVASVDRCRGYTTNEGTEPTGNYSMYLYSECTTVGCNIIEFEQNLTTSIDSSYVKIMYKAWGEFNTSSGAYLRLEIGSVAYNLSVTPATVYGSAVWNGSVFNDTSFQTSRNISIRLHDVLDSGSGMGASHVYIDYVCVANSSGDCVTLYSGRNISRSFASQASITSGENVTWGIPDNETLGKRRVLANASGDYYRSGQDWVDMFLYGWSNVSSGNISSIYCEYNQTVFSCMQNATITMPCNISDMNTTLGIENYNVSFYGDGSLLGYNSTNSSGIAVWVWENSSNVLGQHNISCVISDEPAMYYNATEYDSITMNFSIVSGNTTGEVLVSPIEENATNMTKGYNHSFNLNIIVNNTGNGTMYGVDVNVSTPAGIYASGAVCGVIPISSYCNVTPRINVTYAADYGNQTINVTVEWMNGDSSNGNASNQTSVIVFNKTVLNVVETWINYTIARGDSRNVGNFTTESFGNTEILAIEFSEQGGNASDISPWITYNPSSIAGISKDSDQVVLVNMTVPFNTTVGSYLTNMTVNATGSICSPASECWDVILLNLTVTVADWERTPDNLTKTIGLISTNGTIGSIVMTNNKDSNYSFSVYMTGNGTPYITAYPASFTMSQLGNQTITVFHNTSSGSYLGGFWFVNVTMDNLNSSFPSNLNTTIWLSVINLTVSVLSPNQSNPTSAINASDIINITAYANLTGTPISSSMAWTVEINNQSCTGLQSRYNSSREHWEVNCTAPDISGNPLNNNLTLTGNYTAMSITPVSDIETNAIVYQDITPPQFTAVGVSSVNYYDSVQYVIFSVNATDNGNVSAVWANVSYSGTNVTLTTYTQSGNNYTFNLSSPNNVTDYDIYVFANDTVNLINYTTGWFDVYKPITFTGSSLDPDSNNQTLNFTFYRIGTDYMIHHFGTNASQGDYNHTVHKRDYDILVDYGDQGLRFNSANITGSAIYQHGISDPSNLTNPVRFDLFPNRTSPDITNIDLPNTAENILMAVVVESPYLNYSNGTMILDYSSALSGGSYEEGDLRILYCRNWSFSGRSCPSEFEHFNEGITSNVTTNIFTFNVNSSSTAYAIAESCYPNICGSSPSDPGGPGGGSGSSGSPGTDDSTTSSVCGNGACETGENELNCPQDCLEYAFDIQTDMGGEVFIKMFPGENKTYPFTIVNKLDRSIVTFLTLKGLKDYITLERDVIPIISKGNETINLDISLPDDLQPGVYKTTLYVTSEGETKDVAVTLEVSLAGKNFLSMEVDMVTPRVTIGGDVRFKVGLKNLGYRRRFDINMTYMIKKIDAEYVVKKQTESVNIEDMLTFTRTISLADLEIEPGQYFLETWADFDEFSVKDLDGFEISEFTIIDLMFNMVPWVILALVLVVFGYFGRLRYIKWKISRVRYPLPVDYRKVPQKSDKAFWLGRIADTDVDAWYDPMDLTTHVIVAGSTGAGKSVGASIFIEEALEKNIPVIVFDPTAQWTGFVKALSDENVLKYYNKFRMDKRFTKPYKGMIFEVNDPHLDLDMRKYMNPGEITVFTMNKLKAGQYDVAIKCIIDSIFRITWEESPDLKMIIVFDEVHRLLEKYGGVGGYVSLEKACREFRKWGIGVLMCSQVLADFKEAISGNVLTDIQLNTKSLVDIGKVKEKYGPIYAQRVSRQGIGVGMIQHPKYNEGKPYFVNFRPPYHNPHKITDKEMKLYREFAERLDDMEAKIENMKREGKDTFDVSLELKLAKDKLKQGRFRMAKIYIESLEKYF